jgi:uncharacterized membrane protein
LSGHTGSLVWVAAALYFVVFSVLMVWQYQRYRVGAFDFGIFDQGLWLLSQGEPPFVTVRGLHLFGDHSSYIMILLAPLYWVVPHQEALLVVSVAALAAAGPLAYGIARRLGATPFLSGVVGLTLLLHPALGWSARDNFHPELLAIPLALGGILLFLRARPVWAMALFVLALTAKEDAALLLVPLGIYIALVLRKRAFGVGLAALAATAFLVNFGVLLPHFSPTGDVIYAGRYDQFGEGMTGIVSGLVTRPGMVVAATGEGKSLGYLVSLLAPIPLALLAPRVLLIGVPTLLANVLSSHTYQAEIRWHYTSYLLVTLAIAAATGAGSLTRRGQRVQQAFAAAAVLAVLSAQFIISPSPLTHNVASAGASEKEQAVDTLVSMIPDGVVVSAFSPLVPHLSHRVAIYKFPNPFTRHDYGAGESVEMPSDESVEWIAALTDRYDDLQPLVSELEESGDFEVVYEEGPALLLRRVGRSDG